MHLPFKKLVFGISWMAVSYAFNRLCLQFLSEQCCLLFWQLIVLWLLFDIWLAAIDLAHVDQNTKELIHTNELLRANNHSFTMQLADNHMQHQLLREIHNRLSHHHSLASIDESEEDRLLQRLALQTWHQNAAACAAY